MADQKLKILIGNLTLALLAGSETWTYTLARQLKKMGHQVECYSPELGIVSQELEKEGIVSHGSIGNEGPRPFKIELEPRHDYDYDVIIANHWPVVEELRRQFPTTPIIATIHGIMHTIDGQMAPEHPALNSGVNQFVAVSEEVQEMLQREYGLESTIIRNAFDLERFKDVRPVTEGKPAMFLVNTNYAQANSPEIQIVRDVAKHFGAKVAALGQNFSQTFDTLKAVNDADVVFGMGRSVLEGVAAGRLGVVQGRWGTGGAITQDSVDGLRYYNFSGRDSKGWYASKEELIEMIERHYDPDVLEWSRLYVAREHDIADAAEMYVQLARHLLGQDIVPAAAEEPMKTLHLNGTVS